MTTSRRQSSVDRGSRMLCSLTLVGCLLLTWSSVVAADEEAPIPPEITEHPSKEVAYKVGEAVTLKCRAVGEPELLYQWKVNGHPVNYDSKIQLQSDGSLVLQRPENGTYQCFVSNNYGTAVSTKSLVKAAVLDGFPTASLVRVHRVSVGSYVKLECRPPTSYPTGNIYWGKMTGADGRLYPLDNTDRVTQDYEGSLHFANVLPSDNSSSSSPPYICVVYNPLLRSLVQGSDQRIEVSEVSAANTAPALVWSTPSAIVVVKGSELKMKCIFSGHPTPKVTWLRRDGTDSRMKIGSFGQELIISSVDFVDQGQYQCSATNGVSTTAVTHDFSVTVESIPYWKESKTPANVDAMEEDDVRFECQASGIPKPTISWTINGLPIEALPTDPRRKVGADFLEYTNVTSTDTQVVQCNASNTHGYIFVNAYLRVRAEPPVIIRPPNGELKIVKGQGTILNCEGTGAPLPKFSWFKNSEPVVEEPEHIVLQTPGILEIKNARLEDMGTYECVVKNKFGSDTASSQLVVRDNLVLVTAPVPQTVIAQSAAQFQCVIHVDPNDLPILQVKWFKDGNPLNVEDDRMKATVTSDNDTIIYLVIESSRASDSGQYKCYASTELENVEHDVQLIVKDRPEPPLDVQFTSCDQESTQVSFIPGSDNNEPTTNFTVYVQSSFNNDEGESASVYKVAFVVSGSGPYTATVQLHPWRKYTFYVVAHNSLGSSAASEVSQPCITPPAMPSSNPAEVCALHRSSSKLVIVWKPILESEMNGNNFHYVVGYRRLDVRNAETLVRKVYGVSNTEIIIDDQETFRPYVVYVQSSNAVGPSDVVLKKKKVYSGQGTPTIAPTNFHIVEDSLQNTSVVFAWDPVDKQSVGVNGFIIGYLVTYWKADDKDTTVRTVQVAVESDDERKLCEPFDDHELPSSTRRRRRRSEQLITVNITNLWPYSQLAADVALVNNIGIGVHSEDVAFTTPEGVPSQVPIVNAIETGSTHIKLSWPSPEDSNGVLLGYEVEYGNEQGSQTTEHADYNEINIYNLTADTCYNISVCAKTSAGCGEKFVTNIQTRSLYIPDKPAVLNVALGESWANVSWEVPDASGARPASEYYVEYKEVSSDEWLRTRAERSSYWINVTQLKAPAEYVVRVVAVSGSKYESKSDERQFPVGIFQQPRAIETPPETAASAGSSWVIIVICVVIVAIVIIIVIACFAVRKRRPARYAVKEPVAHNGTKKPMLQDEEKGQGNVASSPKEPEERAATPKPVTSSPLAASSDSLISNKDGEHDDDDDTDSLDDDPDVNKFNEDGSFIGIYGPEQIIEDNAADDDESHLLAKQSKVKPPSNGTIQVSNTQNTPV